MKTLSILILTAALLTGGGCTSNKAVQNSAIAPLPIVSTHASLDGNKANSGIVDTDDGGIHVTPHFLDRYDALLTIYGARLVPSRKPGDRDGIVAEDPGSQYYKNGARWVMTGEAVSQRFDPMNQWRKQDQAKAAPTPKP